MANIIDNTYFINNIHLPVDEISNELTSFIVRFEPEILTKILGYDLKKAFVEGLAEIAPLQKWLDLRDGKDYQYNGFWYKWIGLANTLKQSLIANYVYYQFTVYGSSFNSSNGLRVIKSENSTIINYREKQTLSYNTMIDMIAKMKHFIDCQNATDSTTYPNYLPEVINKINVFNI